MMQELQLKQFQTYLQPRALDAHKGDFGHVVIIGGELGYSGAVILAASAALRVGAGLVSIATRAEHAKWLNVFRPEVMCHGIETEEQLESLLNKATVLVLGPGLGQTTWSHRMFATTLAVEKPIVVDADGLNMLATHPMQKTNWILTPHPGEAGRMLQQPAQSIQQNRIGAVQILQRQYRGWIVLKGAGTLVAGPDQSLSICHAGNPGMATAGMGDVLSGVLGGLLAQQFPLDVSAKLGVLLHATAGDLAAKMGERGMIASDLISYLRDIVN